MTTFILVTPYGVAVINAESQDEALERLKRKEELDDAIVLSHLAKPSDFTILPTASGIVVHHCSD